MPSMRIELTTPCFHVYMLHVTRQMHYHCAKTAP